MEAGYKCRSASPRTGAAGVEPRSGLFCARAAAAHARRSEGRAAAGRGGVHRGRHRRLRRRHQLPFRDGIGGLAGQAIPISGLPHRRRAQLVVDGDTFYFGDDKVRIAGIDAPETHPPRCAREAELGGQATAKLHALLNSGSVTMSEIDRDRDTYGRLLRNVAVDGADVGAAMVSAGVAREYGSGRRSWC